MQLALPGGPPPQVRRRAKPCAAMPLCGKHPNSAMLHAQQFIITHYRAIRDLFYPEKQLVSRYVRQENRPSFALITVHPCQLISLGRKAAVSDILHSRRARLRSACFARVTRPDANCIKAKTEKAWERPFRRIVGPGANLNQRTPDSTRFTLSVQQSSKSRRCRR